MTVEEVGDYLASIMTAQKGVSAARQALQSDPDSVLLEKFGFTVEKIYAWADFMPIIDPQMQNFMQVYVKPAEGGTLPDFTMTADVYLTVTVGDESVTVRYTVEVEFTY